MGKDYYKILGVERNASEDDIKKAFRRLAHEHHPDKGGDSTKFKDLNEAYQILSDKQKRSQYDRFGSGVFEQGAAGGRGGFGGFEGFPGFDFGNAGFQGDLGDLGDVLGEMFGFGGARGGAQQTRGQDLQVNLELTFREAAFGVEREVRLHKAGTCHACKGEGAEPGAKSVTCVACGGVGQVRQAQRMLFGMFQTVVPCPTCHGRGKKTDKPCQVCKGNGVERREEKISFKVPPGVSDGEAMKIQGQGEAAPFGGRAGDLYIKLRVKPDTKFERDDHQLYSQEEIPFTVLALGGSVEVETLEGKTIVKISEGTRSGTVITLRGQGIPYANARSRGDLHVRLAAAVPRKLTKEQREMLKKLSEEGL